MPNRLFVVVILLSACASPSTDIGGGSLQPVPFGPQPGEYYGGAWLDDDSLLVFVGPSTSKTRGGGLWRFSLNEPEGKQILLPQDKSCRVTRYSHPVRLDSGNIALIHECLARLARDDRNYLVSYSPERDSVERLVQEDLGFRIVGDFDWNESLNRGIVSNSNGICSSLYWLSALATEPFRATVNLEEMQLTLDEQSQFNPTESCNDQPRADLPAWSPTGAGIAFFVSPASGPPDIGRLDSPWHLVLLDPRTLSTEEIVAGVIDPSTPTWSPDGKTLAFSGDIEGMGSGVWLYSLESHELTQLSNTTLGWIEWSPDGSALAGVDYSSEQAAPLKYRLVFFPLDT